ncbi:Universal stress protein UspA and related nucleotide-binding protein [Candidatus Nitrosarchaeum limnium SFB1]|jgi:nucleotide-binding universal stress UspA family protein|uniref:Universal stress protein UspA and related nucleotide-binding protein n=1 Tax=Candidatus Nitrosarchaeum limnium SFB1 TaxID=886738 RepID=F3KLX2_9ARCH|nr:Universal stress protein UspA and related nucleotide-binding protein [Candidatus Nitrosarchaeum limnium SFB1]
MYNTILVPHAGTSAGDKALKHAIHAAKSSLAEIILLHVVEEIPRPPMFALSTSESMKLAKSFRNANEDLKKGMISEMGKRVKICNENNIKASIIVTIGSAADEILKIIKKQKVDLVVMAKRRKLKGLKSLLTLGSVSRKIVENTACPVLLIDIE